MGDRQQESLILFVNFIAALCAPTQDLSKMESLKEQVQTALARLERDFPLSLQVYFQIIQDNYFEKRCFLSSLSIIHDQGVGVGVGVVYLLAEISLQ